MLTYSNVLSSLGNQPFYLRSLCWFLLGRLSAISSQDCLSNCSFTLQETLFTFVSSRLNLVSLQMLLYFGFQFLSCYTNSWPGVSQTDWGRIRNLQYGDTVCYRNWISNILLIRRLSLGMVALHLTVRNKIITGYVRIWCVGCDFLNLGC